MPRTSQAEVQEVLDTSLSSTSLSAWIGVANELVDEVESQASNPQSDRLDELERLVAAHLATAQDKGSGRVESRSGAARSESYTGEYGMGFQATDHGQAALALEGVIGKSVLASSTKPAAGLSVPDVKTRD